MPIQLLGAFALMMHATLGVPAGDPARPRLLVSVHVEDHAMLDARLLNDVTAAARDIWRPYVDVVFGRAGDIRRTIEVDELQLVITPRTLAGGEGGLGWIEFVNGKPSRTITVSTTAVARLMALSSWKGTHLTSLPHSARRLFVVRALGRAIAHEMGHYLLQSKAHEKHGLMRDHLTADDIMQAQRVNDRLDENQAQKLWQRVMEFAREGEGIDPARTAPGLPPS